jgi:hypothetical protein
VSLLIHDIFVAVVIEISGVERGFITMKVWRGSLTGSEAMRFDGMEEVSAAKETIYKARQISDNDVPSGGREKRKIKVLKDLFINRKLLKKICWSLIVPGAC